MDALLDEIDSLEAILMDDVKIIKNPQTGFPELIETTIFPIVGEETDRQYICVTLQVMPQLGYPDISPKFQLIKPRGLDDERLNEIENACMKKLSDSLGYPVVFDLIEVIREHLTGSNLPSGQCVICLYGFQDGDEFTKTECFHYLHSYCLARHLIALKKNYMEEQDKLPSWLKKMSDPFQANCPVCRKVITDDAENLKNAKPPLELENAPDFHLTNELKELQTRMTNLYLHQKSRGAIIDPEAEDTNLLILAPSEETSDLQYNHQSLIKETNDSETNASASAIPTNAQSNRRSNLNQKRNNYHQLRKNENQNNGNSAGSQTHVSTNSAFKSTEESSSSSNSQQQQQYNRHHRRHHHHHHHHRSRRHHFNNHQNDSSHQHQENSHQQKANIRTSCESSTR